MKNIVDGFKKVQAVAVFEIAIGVIVAIIFLRLLSVVFGRQSLGTVWGAENADNAEDLENLGGRGQARRAGRQAARGARKNTRQHNRQVLTKTAISEGKKRGSAGRMDDYQPEEQEEPEALPSDEDYAEALEMAEYFESLTQEDLDNMDDAEYAEYAEYMEMAQNAE